MSLQLDGIGVSRAGEHGGVDAVPTCSACAAGLSADGMGGSGGGLWMGVMQLKWSRSIKQREAECRQRRSTR